MRIWSREKQRRRIVLSPSCPTWRKLVKGIRLFKQARSRRVSRQTTKRSCRRARGGNQGSVTTHCAVSQCAVQHWGAQHSRTATMTHFSQQKSPLIGSRCFCYLLPVKGANCCVLTTLKIRSPQPLIPPFVSPKPPPEHTSSSKDLFWWAGCVYHVTCKGGELLRYYDFEGSLSTTAPVSFSQNVTSVCWRGMWFYAALCGMCNAW